MPDDLDKRLREVENRLKETEPVHIQRSQGDTQPASQKSETRSETRSEMGVGMGIGLRLASDFFAAVAVGALLGYWFDRWVDTKPWGLIFFLFLGFVTGVYKLYMTSKTLDE